jgi:hypothetical protein
LPLPVPPRVVLPASCPVPALYDVQGVVPSAALHHCYVGGPATPLPLVVAAACLVVEVAITLQAHGELLAN